MTETMLDTILNDADSIVKFIAILLSASLAFIGILLSQWRTRVRENKAHLRSKYEEIVTELINLKAKRLTVNAFLARSESERNRLYDEYESNTSNLHNAAAKLDMLFSIYAPSIELPNETILKLTFMGHYELKGLVMEGGNYDGTQVTLKDAKRSIRQSSKDLIALQGEVITYARKLI